jgi:hypothetical protein
MTRIHSLIIAAVAFVAIFAIPAVARAHDTGSMVVEIPYQMKLADVLLHGRYIVVHDMKEGESGPCVKVYELKTKKLLTEFHCVHLTATDKPAQANRVNTSTVLPGIPEIVSFQFKGTVDPIGVPGFQK